MLIRIFLICSFLTFLISCSPTNDIVISEAKARATFASATTGAAYLTIENTSNQSHQLTHVTIDKAIADSVEIHTVTMQDGMMQMRELEGGLAIESKSKVKLAPGGYHLMLIGLKKPLEANSYIQITLNFDQAASQKIDIPVVKM